MASHSNGGNPNFVLWSIACLASVDTVALLVYTFEYQEVNVLACNSFAFVSPSLTHVILSGVS